jgi:hypothetical protein
MGSQTNECGLTRDGTIPRRGRSRSIRSPSIRNGASPPPLVLPLLAQNSSIIGAKPSFSARSPRDDRRASGEAKEPAVDDPAPKLLRDGVADVVAEGERGGGGGRGL